MAMIDKVLSTILAPLLVVLLAASLPVDAFAADEDPLEPLNRKIHVFNDTADTYVLRPLAKGYRAVTPQPVERSISRVFANLLEVNSTFNSILQAKFGKAAHHGGRFLINSTVGLVGLFDVADTMGLPRIEGEDFGQTLAVWGVGSGPYVVLPLLGPSTLRDAPSRYVDTFLDPINTMDHVPTRNTVHGTKVLSGRAGLLDAEEMISGDRYTFMRNVYLQRRAYLINDGLILDEFDDFDDFDDYDDFEAQDEGQGADSEYDL
ncbi:MAG: VacJ family lipoprotein [Porticoccaceae bacterium]|nr:VacJ family lipoprotein [Porticoccaceae bacterium]